MPVELLQSYGKRTRDDNIAEVIIASEMTFVVEAKFIDLRLGAAIGKSDDLNIAYARDGRILTDVDNVMHVVHRDGRSIPMMFETGLVVNEPVFIGQSLVVQDDYAYGKTPFGVFDTNTGELRGRIKQKLDPGTGTYTAAPCDAKDGRHVWFSDVTNLCCWDVGSVKCIKKLRVPPKHDCSRVCVCKSGNLVTSIRPRGGEPEDDALLVLAPNGDVVARRALQHMSFAIAGDLIAVMDTAKNRLLFVDDKLEERATAALPPKEDYAELVELWSGLREVIAVDGHNQVHHYGDATLRPKGKAATAPKKKPTKPKKKS